MANNWNIPDWLEKEVRERDKKCVYCGVEFTPLTVSTKAAASWEHIINDAKFITRENIVLCCRGCNARNTRNNRGQTTFFLEHVSLGAWVRAQPAWVDVVLRTVLYAFGVFVVIVIEKAFEGRHEYGGFGTSLTELFVQADMRHVLTNTIVITCALLVYKLLSVVRTRLGEGGLLRLYTTPIPVEPIEQSRD
jgi:hypothetical protein